ncbi:FAD/NAD(P)-binding domain-containing protein [Sodiomyces alkalinus F11]|uniref:FAD/NAD(P)-binding domain-containing protein n=1 Tax=Sodiomyces alkalinus (strain CBS 110278 / VKM F-3762 / F11) TaxID=1314773 RepID=A0A3N2PZL1_SODAK|nr:FAD/NAD(P)-binding domain-containing protein [Sodiomyces alkalinus F11]ROT39960.1 FAD/NAD(P)-binding domain-containing protein [Sodiomyces alkalinus F11]
MEQFDCVVIGAGWYGLGAAKQYHCINPNESLVVFESEGDLGGTWASHRIYPGVKSNNLLGTYEFPDFPMDPDTFDIKPGQHLPGHTINKYLKAYAAEFGISNLIRLNTKVTVAEHQEETAEGGWVLTVVSGDPAKETKVFARRLIVATGLTSEAFLPHFEGQETFGGRIFHGKHFLQNKDTIEPGKTVAVFGGTKFAFDAVYAYASAGVKVNWVIRASGHGPCWISPSYVTPLRKWIEQLANIRFLTWFSPCIWSQAGGYTGVRRFLHGSAIGRFIVDSFWSILGGDVLSLNNLDAHPKTAKLKPWLNAMFVGASFSILNYETDFWELVKGDNVDVYIADLDHLSPGKVHLTDGTALDSDALLAHTGWKHVPPIKFLPEGIEKELGLPHTPAASSAAPASDLANQQALVDRADEDITRQFPRLKHQPVWNKNYVPMTDQKGISAAPDEEVTPYKPLTAWMLYHFVVPASERLLRTRDIAFVGMVSNFSNIITAHLQGLWISAYFSGRLARDPAAAVGDDAAMAKLRYEAVLHNRFGKWRYPVDWGEKTPTFIFDAVPFLDLLLSDLGLSMHRKGGSWSEIWSPYGPRDYKDVNDEWELKYGGGKQV